MGQYERFLLITDLDGTLLPNHKILSDVDLAAIQTFREQGGRFSIATGRTRQAAQRYLDALQLDTPAILFNGAAIYDPETESMLDTRALPSEAAIVVQTVLETFPDVSAEILCAEETYVLHINDQEREHLRICQVTPVVGDFEDIPHTGWLKVLFAMSKERMPDVIAFFQQNRCSFADFVQSEAHFYEMLPAGVTKGSALQKFRKLPQLEGLQIAAAGDFDNDLEMLAAADISACPSNAQPCVKAAADWILSASCDTGAIAELIEKLVRL